MSESGNRPPEKAITSKDTSTEDALALLQAQASKEIVSTEDALASLKAQAGLLNSKLVTRDQGLLSEQTLQRAGLMDKNKNFINDNGEGSNLDAFALMEKQELQETLGMKLEPAEDGNFSLKSYGQETKIMIGEGGRATLEGLGLPIPVKESVMLANITNFLIFNNSGHDFYSSGGDLMIDDSFIPFMDTMVLDLPGDRENMTKKYAEYINGRTKGNEEVEEETI